MGEGLVAAAGLIAPSPRLLSSPLGLEVQGFAEPPFWALGFPCCSCWARDASRAAGAVVPGAGSSGTWALSTLPNGCAFNLSRDGEEHCLNPQLPVNYLVESCQNNAVVAVRALMAAVAGTEGFQRWRSAALQCPAAGALSPRGAQGTIRIQPQVHTRVFRVAFRVTPSLRQPCVLGA